jgi:excisionase family DNA binding protein
MMAETEDRLLSVADVASLLSVTEPTIRLWIKEGKLRAHRAGARFWRIRQSEVNRMLAESNRSPVVGSGQRPPSALEARDLLSSLITNPQSGEAEDGG